MQHVRILSLFLLLVSRQIAYSQELNNDNFEGGSAGVRQHNRKQLGIGDKIPSDITVQNVVNYKTPTIKMSDFRGKFLIIDFWEPWCGSCISAFPELDSIQKKFADKLQVLSVSTTDKTFALQILNKIEKARGIKMLSAIEDSVVSNLFNYRFVPHYIWIDRDGVIKYVTGLETVNEENVNKFINGGSLTLQKKIDSLTTYDGNNPLLITNRLNTPPTVLYNSIMTKYIQELPATSIIKKNFIHCSNHPIKQLFKLAFGNFSFEFLSDNRVILEGFNTTMDSVEIGAYRTELRPLWRKIRPEFAFCYELAFADSTFSREYKSKIMQQDLNRFFAPRGIQGRVEKRKQKILSLERTSSEDKLKTAGGKSSDKSTDYKIDMRNRPMSLFVAKLQLAFYKPGTMPVQDQTKYKGNVDIIINADLTDINALNDQLKNYDLKLVVMEKEIDMVIISKKQVPKVNQN